MNKCCVSFAFPLGFQKRYIKLYLKILLKHFFPLWSGPEGFRLLSRRFRIKKYVCLDLAVEMEGFSEDRVRECWTEEIGLEEGEGYKFLELDPDEELRLADWGDEIIRATPVVEYVRWKGFRKKQLKAVREGSLLE